MVGTGRFELPIGSTGSRAPRMRDRRIRCANAGWGASWPAVEESAAYGAEIERGEIMVGTGRFELPTPRTPSECSTRLSINAL